jgi:hypothetical protein
LDKGEGSYGDSNKTVFTVMDDRKGTNGLKDTAVKKQLKDINIKALCFIQLDIISNKLDGILAERKKMLVQLTKH